MKNTLNVLGMIAIVAIVGFSFTACGDDDGGIIPGIPDGSFTEEDLPDTSIGATGTIPSTDVAVLAAMAIINPPMQNQFEIIETWIDAYIEDLQHSFTGPGTKELNKNFNAITYASPYSTFYTLSDRGIKNLKGKLTGSMTMTESSGYGSAEWDPSYDINILLAGDGFIKGTARIGGYLSVSGDESGMSTEQGNAMSYAIAFNTGSSGGTQYRGKAVIDMGFSYSEYEDFTIDSWEWDDIHTFTPLEAYGTVTIYNDNDEEVFSYEASEEILWAIFN